MTQRSPSTNPTARWKPHQLHDDPERHLPAPGCSGCVDRPTCGTIRAATGLFDCSIHCCNQPESCAWVCRRNPRFRQQMQEIGGLSLDNVVISAAPQAPDLPIYAPQVFHASLRTDPLVTPAVAIKLIQLFDKRSGKPRYTSRAALLEHFMIADGAQIIVTGVDDDPPIERWWHIGRQARREVIAQLADMGVAIATTPNYSLSLNWPRVGDMSAMKRILLCAEEMMTGGLPTALHVNGRTPHDFARWSKVIQRIDGITHLAYEFTTGAAYGERRERHVAWLCELAANAGRPLDIIVFGDRRVVTPLSSFFARVTWIDTSSFMKTIHRKRATRSGNGKLVWIAEPTAPGQSLHELLAHNVDEGRAHFALGAAA